MAKSLRDTWRNFKDGMAGVGKKAQSVVSKDLAKKMQESMDKILATFTGGFGPLLDKFEAAEKKQDIKTMKDLQVKLHALIKTYQANARSVLPDLSGVPNAVVGQLDKFKAEIDKRMK